MAQKTHKTHKGLAKRFKLSANGKPSCKKPYSGHLMSGKAGRRKQKLRRPCVLDGKIADNIRRALGAA
jgi:large subunit ribosomal protein L35